VKQRQRRHDDVRLTKSGDARSEQLLVMPTVLLTNREWLPGQLFSGSNIEGPAISDLLTCIYAILLKSKALVYNYYLLNKKSDTPSNRICVTFKLMGP